MRAADRGYKYPSRSYKELDGPFSRLIDRILPLRDGELHLSELPNNVKRSEALRLLTIEPGLFKRAHRLGRIVGLTRISLKAVVATGAIVTYGFLGHRFITQQDKYRPCEDTVKDDEVFVPVVDNKINGSLGKTICKIGEKPYLVSSQE